MKLRAFSLQLAFTLIEVLVSTVIVVILAGILISATDMTAKSFSRTSAKIEQFSEARRGFETVTRRLTEATLNTYFDYYDTTGVPRPTLDSGPGGANAKALKDFIPSTYGRQSELRFTSGPMTKLSPASTADRPTHGVFFQAPVGEVSDREKLGMLDHTLNSWGYFIEVDKDEEFIPVPLKTIVQPRRRSRLLEFRQPTEVNPIYFPPYAGDAGLQSAVSRNWWFIDSIDKTEDRPVRVVSENIIALIVVPRLSRNDELNRQKQINVSASSDKGVLCPDYFYDSALKSNHTPALTSRADRPEDVNPKNQLPPVVQVVMVALDEASASRLDAATVGQGGFGLMLENIFKKSVDLEDNPDSPEPSDGELHDLERILINSKLTYRIFNTTVIIRGAKWSRAQS